MSEGFERMQLLKDRILKDGIVREGNVLKVDSFLNHQMDVKLFEAMGQEFFKRFAEEGITKVLTVEASGIGIACFAALPFEVPVVFAKKTQTTNLDNETFQAPVHSFTHNKDYIVRVSKKYLSADDRVLIIDDFLANGEAVRGLLAIVDQAGATLCGVGIAIEKGFQAGGKELRESGLRVESLAIIESMNDGTIRFRD